MGNLEAQFHQAMVDVYISAKRDCHYNATIFWNMVLDRGGLATAKQLLATNTPSDGFTTQYLCGRLDLTVEAHVIRPEYAELFTPDEITIGNQRLQQYGYDFDAH